MEKLRILNSKETKRILAMLTEQWAFKRKLDYVFLMNEKSKLYITSREFSRLDTQKLRINSVGLYFGELSNEELRLSIEGSQLIGPYAGKNLVELSSDEQLSWLRGNDLDKKAPDGFVILTHKKDFIGCGKSKQGKILNYVPKTRRIN